LSQRRRVGRERGQQNPQSHQHAEERFSHHRTPRFQRLGTHIHLFVPPGSSFREEDARESAPGSRLSQSCRPAANVRASPLENKRLYPGFGIWWPHGRTYISGFLLPRCTHSTHLYGPARAKRPSNSRLPHFSISVPLAPPDANKFLKSPLASTIDNPPRRM
jgi:hypothetical protein